MIKNKILKSSYLYRQIAEELFDRIFVLQAEERLEEVKKNKSVMVDNTYGGIDFSLFCEKKDEKFKELLDVCTDVRDRHLTKEEKIRELEKFIKDSLIESNLHIRKEFVYGMMFYRSTEDGRFYVSGNAFFDIFHSMFFCTTIDTLKKRGILGKEELAEIIEIYRGTRNDKVPQLNPKVISKFGTDFGNDDYLLTCTDSFGRSQIDSARRKHHDS